MEIFVTILEFLLKEIKKLSLHVRIGFISLFVLETLILFATKDEILFILEQYFKPNDKIYFFLLVLLIIPIACFLLPWLVLSAFALIDRFFLTRQTKKESSSSNQTIDLTIPDQFQLVKKLSVTNFSTVFLVTDKNGKKYLLKHLHNKNTNGVDLPSQITLGQPLSRFMHDGNQFELLHYFEGWTLAEIIDLNRNKSGVYGELLETWTKQLLAQLAILHSNNPPIVHRDINPSNILVRNDTLEVVLLDFSSSIQLVKRNSQARIGNAIYSPPEQLLGKAVPASDLYALGMTMYAMNQCKQPPSSSARKYGINTPLELVKTSWDTCIDEIFVKCIEIDSKKRHQNAQEVLDSFCHPMTHEDFFIDILALPDGRSIDIGDLSWTILNPGEKRKKRQYEKE